MKKSIKIHQHTRVICQPVVKLMAEDVVISKESHNFLCGIKGSSQLLFVLCLQK